MSIKGKLSIVITLFNEEENVRPLLNQIRESLNGFSYEIILVDDGSSDRTVAEVRAVAEDDTILIQLTKNFGQTAAMSAGIDHAAGDYVITMDGDLQNDPSDIPALVEELESGDWDMVAGRRANRKDGFILRKIPSRIANWFIRKWTGVKVSDYGCSLKIMRIDMARGLGLYGELHRFIPVLVQLQGGTITNMDVKHHARIHGKSKYGLGRTSRVMSDLVLMVFFQKYAKRPMHLFGGFGLISLMAGMSISMYLLVLKIMGQDIWGRPILILGITLVLVGVQFLTFGIMTEILMRTWLSASNRNPYKIRKVHKRN